MKKLVLAVIDSLKPAMLDQAIADGRAPILKELTERGTYVRDCVSSYPSVTPVASASITTGLGPAEHMIASMNWFHRGEERYVEYGSSFRATRAFGIVRSLYDTVYNMNMGHLARDRKTVFEHLDDAGLRTACTTFLIYRGRHRHEPSPDNPFRRISEAAQFRHAVWGPEELFYADLFDSRDTGCTSTLGMPGQRDRHTGCVGAHLVENDLYDFMLFSLPDNDTYSHKHGPDAQPTSLAAADKALEQLVHAAGGLDQFLAENAIVVMSDHSQTEIQANVNLAGVLPAWRVLDPADVAPADAQIAVCPAARSGMVYALEPESRERTVPRIAGDLHGIEGVDLVAHRAEGQAVVWSERGELRFAPGGDLRDRRGQEWTVTGDAAALDLELGATTVDSGDYPDALGRLWSALDCPQSGEVLISGAPGYEFLDWGGSHHVGGGSHGSLLRDDSHGGLIMCGVEGADAERPWALRDVTPLILEHFSVSS